MKYRFTAEELFNLPEYKQIFISEIGNPDNDDYAKSKYKKDIAKTRNYKDDIFYHATGGTSEIGVGKGLYLGKDKNAVHNFYNGEGEFGDEVEICQGSPNFIDLTEPKKFEEFEKEAIAKYGKSSDKNYLNKNTLRLGFDGIRYFDPCTTGEEFVLFNVDKVKMISNKKRKKEDLSNFFN